MAIIRFQLDLAIPETVYDTIPSSKKIAMRDAIRAVKAYAVKINDGSLNEETTVKATWHRCHHDENLNISCEPEQEI